MIASNVRTKSEALRYLADCQLATVSDMAMKKSRPKYDYIRHIQIAQKAVNWLRDFGIEPEKGERAFEVINDFKGIVSDWARKYES